MNRNYEDKSLPSWNVSVFEKWEGGKEERETRLLLKFGGGIMLVLCNARKKLWRAILTITYIGCT